MKVYKFYKLPTKTSVYAMRASREVYIRTAKETFSEMNEEDIIESANRNYSDQHLYKLGAWTTDKKIRKIFKESRDMDMYLEVIDDIQFDSYDWDMWLTSTDVDGTHLEFKELRSGKDMVVNIPITEDEWNSVTTLDFAGYILTVFEASDIFPIQIFSPEVQQYLRAISYDVAWEVFNGGSNNFDPYADLVHSINCTEPSDSDMRPFWKFYMLFKDLLNAEGIANLIERGKLNKRDKDND